MVILKKIFEEV
jgi:hypothetical protein